ncbi:MAG TPA: ATPase [Alphaproteobacteria bacterium]|nr:ATPase [Alphaproteobacteria bacterium]
MLTPAPAGAADAPLAVAPGVVWGARPDLTPLAALPLLVLVGVTGVGKSTTVEALRETGPAFGLLPDRRVVTDRAIMARYAGGPVADRIERFRITARFRAEVPGGMAAVLAGLHLDPAILPPPLLFDGLRGAEEAVHAAAALPLARFAVLTAPDALRLRRLLGRADPFDTAGAPAAGGADFAEYADVLDAAERGRLAAAVAAGQVAAAAVREKLAIIAEERRSYDPDAAAIALLRVAPDRTVVVDTARHDPQAAAALIAPLLRRATAGVPR